MASCQLRVELDTPDQIYQDGSSVRGVVVVQASEGVNCKALEVSSQWSTHGRGNIDRAELDKDILFSGQWLAGQEYRYAFELRSASWPPTYYGNFLNVSHTIVARAKLAWARDPTAQAEYTVVAAASPEDLAPQRASHKQSLRWLGWLIGGVFLLAFSWFLLFLVPFLLIAGGLVWFFKSYLPKSLLGQVDCQVEPLRLKLGSAVRASLRFTPKRKLQLNGISASIECEERCVSGSGSNRKTHVHSVHSHTHSLLDACQLLPGQQQELSCEYTLPNHLPASLKLSDNELNWWLVMRIDIPKWPDWSKKFPLVVEPATEISQVNLATALAGRQWLGQVVEQLHNTQSDAASLGMVLDAIHEHVFDVKLEIVERIALAPQPQPQPGSWYAAYEESLDADFALFIPQEFAAPQIESTWIGQLQIIGFQDQVIARMVG